MRRGASVVVQENKPLFFSVSSELAACTFDRDYVTWEKRMGEGGGYVGSAWSNYGNRGHITAARATARGFAMRLGVLVSQSSFVT